MALLPKRFEAKTDISFFCNSVTERGVILVHGSSGSGEAMDQTVSTAVLPGTGAVAGLKPIGLLLNDVVETTLDNPYPLGFFRKDRVRKGGKVTLAQQGFYLTNMIPAGVTPVAGDAAYLAPGGRITNDGTGGVPKVGRFLSAKNERGYAKVEILLPN